MALHKRTRRPLSRIRGGMRRWAMPALSILAVLFLAPLWASTAGTPSATAAANTTTGGGACTSPVFSSTTGEATHHFGGTPEYWWVSQDEWSGDGTPQAMHACSQQSWYVNATQTTRSGAVETYPDTEYDVTGRGGSGTYGTVNAKTPISGWKSITATFAETAPKTGNWDFGFDLWTDDWSHETMIWNQWQGGQSYWPSQSIATATLGGTEYTFTPNGSTCNTSNVGGCELIFARKTQAASGSVNILAAYQWEVAHGYAKASDVPTQLEYGVEIAGTNGSEKFAVTGFTLHLTSTAGASQPTGTPTGGTTPPPVTKTKPSAPQNLRVTAHTATSATLAWTAPATTGNTPIGHYNVRKTAKYLGASKTTNDTVKGLSASTTYHFTVRAANGQGTGPASNTAAVTTTGSGGGGTTHVTCTGTVGTPSFTLTCTTS